MLKILKIKYCGQIIDIFDPVKTLIITFSILFSGLLFGQDTTNVGAPNYNDSLITIYGNVVDTTKSISFYNVMVINKTLGKGIFGDYDGSFVLTIKKSHQFAVSVVGYKTQYFNFKNKKYKKSYDLTVYLDLNSFVAKTVVVKPLKTLAELKEERSAIAKRELPEITVGSAIQSPITALYMTFSKREKTKKRVAEMEFKDQQRAVVKEILRVYIHADILDLQAEEFDAFITFLNLNTAFLKTATDYELIVYIKYKYEHFQKLNRDGF